MLIAEKIIVCFTFCLATLQLFLIAAWTLGSECEQKSLDLVLPLLISRERFNDLIGTTLSLNDSISLQEACE